MGNTGNILNFKWVRHWKTWQKYIYQWLLSVDFGNYINANFRFSAVRLGRCPKKEKPASSHMLALPQDREGGLDVEKQASLEQMVLNVHEAFRKATTHFQDYLALQKKGEVRILLKIYFDEDNDNYILLEWQ